jgi:hypothetical protein
MAGPGLFHFFYKKFDCEVDSLPSRSNPRGPDIQAEMETSRIGQAPITNAMVLQLRMQLEYV